MGLLGGLLLWVAGLALRCLLLAWLVVLVVALHPPTMGALVSKLAMAVGGAGKGKSAHTLHSMHVVPRWQLD